MPIYMNYSGITGNVQGMSGLPGQWIEISSFQWGVGRGISESGGSSADREGSTPSVGEIVVTKPTDVSLPNFVNQCLGGAKSELEVSIVFTGAAPGSGPRNT